MDLLACPPLQLNLQAEFKLLMDLKIATEQLFSCVTEMDSNYRYLLSLGGSLGFPSGGSWAVHHNCISEYKLKRQKKG